MTGRRIDTTDPTQILSEQPGARKPDNTLEPDAITSTISLAAASSEIRGLVNENQPPAAPLSTKQRIAQGETPPDWLRELRTIR